MLLPRFSIRTMLLVATGVAIAAIFAGQAVSGRVWALGVTVALVSVGFSLLTQAAFFAVGSWAARRLGAQDIVARTSRGGIERTSAADVIPPVHPNGELLSDAS
ncbi:MAG TPA: hypothetical protein VF175_14625 [Lacipirellula sp.]